MEEITIQRAALLVADGSELTSEQRSELLWAYGPSARSQLDKAVWELKHARDPERYPRPLTEAERAYRLEQEESARKDAARNAEWRRQDAEKAAHMPVIIRDVAPKIVTKWKEGGGTVTHYLPDYGTVLAAQREGRHVQCVGP